MGRWGVCPSGPAASSVNSFGVVGSGGFVDVGGWEANPPQPAVVSTGEF